VELKEAWRVRRAVRDYTDEPVDHLALKALIDAAVLAPSAMNLQPWAFVVIEGAARLDAFSERVKAHLIGTMTNGSPLARYRDMMSDPGFHIFYHAQSLVVVCATGPETQTAEDCCLAALGLMLAAHDKGLGTCWIGFARPWLCRPDVKAELMLPRNYEPVAPIIVGHPKHVPEPTPRDRPKIIWSA
jgi:nitroreductase